ncbi:DivIVA domain-containing protein, partial [candidate division GN15 bacterium]|nr:DivIVA domain-containing protein [candidate division GN15 bacterium]
MDLSPNDVRNYEFPSQMRGYDKEEVNNFKEQV